MAEKEAFYCTISFFLFAAIRSFLTNLPYYFSVVHAFQSSALHLYSFHCFDFLGYNANIPRPCQCGRNLMKFGNSLVHLSPNVTFSQIFCYRAHWVQSYLCLFFILLHLTVTINWRVCLRPCEAMEKKGNKILKMHEP